MDVTAEIAPVAVNDQWETPVETTTTTTTNDQWDQPAQASSTEDASWDVVNAAEATPAPAVETPQPSSRPDGTRTWASIFKPQVKPAPPVQKVANAPPPQEPAAVEEHHASIVETPVQPAAVQDIPLEEPVPVASPSLPPSEPAIELTPSKDQLTESNLEQVPGSPKEPASVTVASTAGTNDPRSLAGSVTPAQLGQQNQLRPGLGGYQTTAFKATSGSGRSSSFVRRVKEQQEAVVMPGNHAVDRTAVQFGSMGLGGSPDLDVDDEREGPETRTQPPSHSPVAPKASLPPAPSLPLSDSMKPGPGPIGSSGPSATPSQQDQMAPQPSNQSGYSYSQFSNLYGPPAGQSNESSVSASKAYEPFGQQVSQGINQSINGYSSQSQAAGQPTQAAQHPHSGGFSSAANDYPSYYTSDHRSTYQNLYGGYGQQPQAPHDSNASQSKSSGTYNTASLENPSQQATSHPGHPSQTRFGSTEAQNSGHSTPNPAGQQAQTQAPGNQANQAHQMAQAHSQGNQHGYPYGATPYFGQYYPGFVNQHSYGRERPPFDDVRRYDDGYVNQNHHYGYGGNQGGYGGAPYAGGKYGQPHQGYGMSPQNWDAHSGSPANVGGFGQQPHSMSARDSSSALGAYARAGSAQPSEGQQHGAGTFGSIPDVFSRSQSNYSGPNAQQSGNQQSNNDDSSRAFGETSKVTGGPSPVPAGRPNSAANMQNQSSQAQGQQGYSGYPQMGAHGQQSHYGSSIGSLGHQNANQGHQGGAYGAYGAFGNNYYGTGTRGGWSGSYGH